MSGDSKRNSRRREMMKKTTRQAKSPEDYLKEPYSRVITPEEEGGYSAEILEFPGCYSQGETIEETYRNIEEAAKNWIEAALAMGQEIPLPSSNQDYSGKFPLRLPRSIHREAARMAERDGVSLNTFLVGAIAARVGAESLYDRIAQRVERQVINRAAEAVNRVQLLFNKIRYLEGVSYTESPEHRMADTSNRVVVAEELGRIN
jgi:predicted RNase H-like HicB family nuclease